MKSTHALVPPVLGVASVVLSSSFARPFEQNLCNTPAYDSPLLAESVESTALGLLPTGWTLSGAGSAAAVNTQNHTPAGTMSVELSVDAGASAMVTIPFSASITGNSTALRTPGAFGKSGLLKTRTFGIWGGVPNTLIAENILDLSNGHMTVAFSGLGPPPAPGFDISGAEVDDWRVDDLDASPGCLPVRESWHSSGGTHWSYPLVPPAQASLQRFEVELVSSGVDPLSVYVDDFHSYDQSITICCGSPGDCDFLDDGVSENPIGLTGGGEVLWLQKQGVPGGTTVVKSIGTAWGSAAFPGRSPPNGTPARVGIWQDTDDNGDPSDGLVRLRVVDTTVQNADTDMLNIVNLSPPILVPGVYFIGAGCVGTPPQQYPAPLDQTVASGGRAWIVGDTTPPLDYDNLNAGGIGPFEMDAIGLPGVWLLRADCKDISITPMCFGDGTDGPCPCANPPGGAGRGCPNSVPANTGARLAGSGDPMVSADTLSLVVTDIRPSTLVLFIQGDVESNAAPLGDGLRCAGGHLKRLFKCLNPSSTITLPSAQVIPPNTSVSARSAALGDSIVNGTRIYQVFYRDPLKWACPSPATFNLSSGLRVFWSL